MNYESLSAEEIKKGIESKTFSAKEVVTECFKKVSIEEKKVDAFLTLCEEEALKKAEEVDRKISEGKSLGKLAGIPIAVKDNICTQNIKTTCASKILQDYFPPYNATVVEKLLREDAIIIGKTNMDEFAMGSSNENSAFKKTKNPVDLERVPGGSSGGSAAAVASGMVPLSLGSDTGGSIRQPAAFCGVVGMKPTYGKISRYGLVAFGSSLDQIGPFSRNIKDTALLMNVIQGEDKMDATTIKGQVDKDYIASLSGGIKGLKIAVPKEFFIEGLDHEIEASIKANIKILESLGAEIEEISLPLATEGLSAYYIISSAEASSNLSRYDGIRYGYRTNDFSDIDELIVQSRTEGFGEEVKRRIMLGTYALSSGYYDAYYNRAQKFRKKLKAEFNSVFEKFDTILSPVSPVLPFKIGERSNDPLQMYLADTYTININLTGLPAISIPCGVSASGLPIGLQLIGPHLGEEKILKTAYALEQR